MTDEIWTNTLYKQADVRTEYYITRYKKDKRFREGYNYRTFEFVSEAYSLFSEAQKNIPKDDKYVYAIESVTKYIK